MRTHGSVRGFTLVETALVVVIIGILATIALVGYRRYITRSRMLEGTSMVKGIVEAEERYKAERGAYAHINEPNACWYPREPGRYVTQWGGPCPCCKKQWNVLGVTASGPVAFGFGATAGKRTGDAVDGKTDDDTGMKTKMKAPQAFGPGAAAPSMPEPSVTTGPWFVVAAVADFDGDPTLKTTMLYDSDVKVIATANDGE